MLELEVEEEFGSWTLDIPLNNGSRVVRVCNKSKKFDEICSINLKRLIALRTAMYKQYVNICIQHRKNAVLIAFGVKIV